MHGLRRCIAVALCDCGQQIDTVRCGGVSCRRRFCGGFQYTGRVRAVTKCGYHLIHAVGQICRGYARPVRYLHDLAPDFRSACRHLCLCSCQQGCDIGQLGFIIRRGLYRGHPYGSHGGGTIRRRSGDHFSCVLCGFSQRVDVLGGGIAGGFQAAVGLSRDFQQHFIALTFCHSCAPPPKVRLPCPLNRSDHPQTGPADSPALSADGRTFRRRLSE